MNLERTELQTDGDLKASEELSLRRTRPPREIPGYSIERFLGAGAYGEVWYAVASNTGRRVAIKFYNHRASLEDSLIAREVEKLVFLSADRYVVQLLDVGWDSDPPYYVMEYVESGSLEDLLKRSGPLPVDRTVEIFHDIVVGLLHAHAKGILHCDLKPANILLDQDGKARLADFGQSRLSHEQKPALGTLFYMAPEQAELSAVPDVSWDVYALGSILYTMLTGDPPFRSAGAIGEIDSAAGLTSRLDRYRQIIQNADPPVAHRDVPGVDRELVDMIDRQLAVNPRRRYPNVQAVLDALRVRQRNRERRPLVWLGVIAPAVLLAIMLAFGFWGYSAAVSDSAEALASKSWVSNQFAAELAATNVAHDIESLFDDAERFAKRPDVLATLQSTLDTPELKDLLSQLRDPNLGMSERAQLVHEFQEHPSREPLQNLITERWAAGNGRYASWFLLDKYGFHIASSAGKSVDSPVGGYYGYRSYFHGGEEDFEHPAIDPRFHASVPPQGGIYPTATDKTHLSAVFLSTASNTWKCAISAPIQVDGETIAVASLTINVGNFPRFEGSPEQFAVLVDERPGPNSGMILQHPLFDELLQSESRLPDQFCEDPKLRVRVESIDKRNVYDYIDPLSQDPAGAALAGPWIAAIQSVRITPGDETDSRSTGLVVLVQEKQASAVGPIHSLGKKLATAGVTAMAIITALAGAMWGFVLRSGSRSSRGTFLGSGASATPIHDQATVILPKKR
ncbi:serine/threonine protein kinase [Blastopirellula sp. J2-11]|uniref:serine/threonine-protein kinase n=1 Tax=Blastopirellula sp. J2-11 TaxID=2943192 RepID=UPI0021C6C4D9|nr:serine/threonine-protein kinase [Blastopirellula sp. J2-11]UUO06112.1 serine/threonine protein kinase [Blastopirellula sp. J2-11]